MWYKTITDPIKHCIDFSINKGSRDSPTASSAVDIFPSQKLAGNYTRYLPARITLGVGAKNNYYQFFEEIAGGGILDENRESHIEFLARLCYKSRINLVNNLYGVPERNFIHYWTPNYDLYLGDGIYTLTPLTLLYCYATGGSVMVFKNRTQMRTFYFQEQTHHPQTSYGGSVAYRLTDYCRITSAIMGKHLTPGNAAFLNLPQESLLYAFRTEFFTKKIGYIDLEYAHGGKGAAYYAYAAGSPWKKGWYSMKFIHGDPQFTGYYTDTRQSSVSFGLSLKHNIIASYSCNTYSANLNKKRRKKNAPRDFVQWGGLSHTFACNLYASLNYNDYHSNNALHHSRDYTTRFLCLILSKTWNKFTGQAVVEMGRHQGKHKSTSNRQWQNYQLYLSYVLNQKLLLSTYTQQGNVLISSRMSWTQLYGVGFNFCCSSSWNLQANYERSYEGYKRQRNYLNGNLIYKFVNGKQITLRGYWNDQRGHRHDASFLFTFTVPFGIPVGRDCRVGSIGGCVYDE